MPPYQGPDWYVSPYASPFTGEGSWSNPYTLQAAGVSSRIQPGQIVYLLGGPYVGNHTISLSGAIGNHVLFRSYPGERVIIDGKTIINGHYITLKDLEFTYSGWPTRITNTPGSDPDELEPECLVQFENNDTFMINCILHDLHNGTNGPGLMYGCLTFNNGWSGPDRGHGHGIYLSNNNDAIKLVENNFSFDNFEIGFKVYTEGVPLRNVALRKNISFNNNSIYFDRPNSTQNKKWNYLMGGYYLFTNPELRENISYHSPFMNGEPSDLGWVGGALNAISVNNYCPDGSFISQHCVPDYEENSGNYQGPGVGNEIFVQENIYQPGRAHIAIFNGNLEELVVIPANKISGILDAGDLYRLRNVQDYWNDVVVGVVAQDGTINVDMRANRHTVRAPLLWTSPPTTFPEFGAFVIDKI